MATMGKKDLPTDSLDTLRHFLNGCEIAAAPFFTASSTDFAAFFAACVEFEALERRDNAQGIVIRQLEEMIVEP